MENRELSFVSNRLRRFRKVRGLNQRQVADIMGLKGTSMLSRWESGRCLPETLNLFRLAVIYRTSPEALYFDFVSGMRVELIKKEEQLLISGVAA